MNLVIPYVTFVLCLLLIYEVHATSKTSSRRTTNRRVPVRRKQTNRTEIETRIIGGFTTSQNDYSHMVRLKSRFLNGRGASCGATIWNKYSILTASHCVFMCPGGIKASTVEACIGDYDLSVKGDGEQCYTTSSIITHEGYRACQDSNWYKNDIAVLKFNTPLNVPYAGNQKGQGKTSFVSPPIQVQDGAPIVITGWGTTDPSPSNPNPPIPSKLMGAKLKFLSTESCNKYWRLLGGGQICGEGTPGHDACRGDSGGPLVYKDGSMYRLIGLTSFGTPQCASGTPAVYTSALYFQNWIVSNAGPNGHTRVG